MTNKNKPASHTPWAVHNNGTEPPSFAIGEGSKVILPHLTNEEIARLIAAAPDLLAALKDARLCLALALIDSKSKLMVAIDAAIAKAEGHE